MHIIPVKVLKWDSKNAIIKKQQIDLRKEIWYLAFFSTILYSIGKKETNVQIPK